MKKFLVFDAVLLLMVGILCLPFAFRAPVDAELVTHRIIATGEYNYNSVNYLSVLDADGNAVDLDVPVLHGTELTIDCKPYSTDRYYIEQFIVNNIDFTNVKNNKIVVDSDVHINLVLQQIVLKQIHVVGNGNISNVKIWQMLPVDAGGPRVINTSDYGYVDIDSDVEVMVGDYISITADIADGYVIDSCKYYCYNPNNDKFFVEPVSYDIGQTITIGGDEYVFEIITKPVVPENCTITIKDYGAPVRLISDDVQIELNNGCVSVPRGSSIIALVDLPVGYETTSVFRVNGQLMGDNTRLLLNNITEDIVITAPSMEKIDYFLTLASVPGFDIIVGLPDGTTISSADFPDTALVVHYGDTITIAMRVNGGIVTTGAKVLYVNDDKLDDENSTLTGGDYGERSYVIQGNTSISIRTQSITPPIDPPEIDFAGSVKFGATGDNSEHVKLLVMKPNGEKSAIINNNTSISIITLDNLGEYAFKLEFDTVSPYYQYGDIDSYTMTINGEPVTLENNVAYVEYSEVPSATIEIVVSDIVFKTYNLIITADNATVQWLDSNNNDLLTTAVTSGLVGGESGILIATASDGYEIEQILIRTTVDSVVNETIHTSGNNYKFTSCSDLEIIVTSVVKKKLITINAPNCVVKWQSAGGEMSNDIVEHGVLSLPVGSQGMFLVSTTNVYDITDYLIDGKSWDGISLITITDSVTFDVTTAISKNTRYYVSDVSHSCDGTSASNPLVVNVNFVPSVPKYFLNGYYESPMLRVVISSAISGEIVYSEFEYAGNNVLTFLFGSFDDPYYLDANTLYIISFEFFDGADEYECQKICNYNPFYSFTTTTIVTGYTFDLIIDYA